MSDHSRSESTLSSLEAIYNSYLDFSRSGRQWVFRGQESSGWRLRSTLERAIVRFGLGTQQFPDRCASNYSEQEDSLYRVILAQGLEGRTRRSAFDVELALLRKFKRQCYVYTSQVPSDESTMEWLALMRHYFAPTRLLDWTYSYFVALFFAIENATGPAAVWALDTDWLRDRLGQCYPSALSLLDQDQHVERETFKALFTSDKANRLVCAVNPYRRNRRLSIQAGVFLCPGRIDIPFEDNLIGLLDDQIPGSVFCKLIVEVSSIERNEILKHLQRMNVYRASLFPGLEGFARSLETTLAFPDILVPEPI